MEDICSGPSVKLSKSERKLRKKVTKAQRTLLKHEGIETSEIVTKVLCVNNAGLDVGVSYDEVVEAFNPFGKVDEIIMLPKKPYAFVCYRDEESAQRAMDTLNGTKLAQSPTRSQVSILYIFFVSRVPPGLSPSTELPPGLILLEDFVTEEYAENILSVVNLHSCESVRMDLKHRQVKHYGFEFKYGINDVDADDPLSDKIPDICSSMLDKAVQTGYVKHIPDQLTVNRYLPGQGIPPHIDTGPAFEDGIMSLSLGSQVVMDFYHPDGQHLTVLLPPRSLLIMTGESRYVWSHGITPRKSDIVPSTDRKLNVVQRGIRTSFTFRKIIRPEERKRRQDMIDSDVGPTIPVSSTEAETLERQHVHDVYEEIADHFSGTRHSPWPRISEFLAKQKSGSVMADIGCGNGKYLGINKTLYQIGSDRSTKLTEICRERGFQAFIGDVLSIPLRSESMDVCICIAVIHHLSTEERRLKALSEILRILRPGGEALIYVWAMEQEMNKVKSKYLKEKTFTDITVNKDSAVSTDITVNKDSAVSTDITVNKDSAVYTDITVNKDSTVSTDITVNKDSTISTDITVNKTSAVSTDITVNKHSAVSTCTDIGEDENDVNCNTCENIRQETEKLNLKLSNSENRVCKKQLVVHTNRTQFKQQDLLVPWKLKGSQAALGNHEEAVFHRFYHVFQRGELENLCARFENCDIVESYYDQGNWAVILHKHSD